MYACWKGPTARVWSDFCPWHDGEPATTPAVPGLADLPLVSLRTVKVHIGSIRSTLVSKPSHSRTPGSLHADAAIGQSPGPKANASGGGADASGTGAGGASRPTGPSTGGRGPSSGA